MTWRRAVLAVSGLILGALSVAPVWLFRAELPSPMATQWDLAGHPQSATSPLGFGLLIGGLAALGVVSVWWAAAARSLASGARRALAGLGGAHAAFLAGVACQVVRGQRGVVDWRAASGPSLLDLAIILCVSLAAGSFLSLAARRWPGDTPAEGAAGQGAPATVGLRADEHAVWVRRVTAPWLYGLAALGGALLVVGLALGQTALTVTGAVWLALCSEMATAVVSVDQRGLWVRWGSFGLWRTGVRLGDVVTAEAIEIQPLEWGGWGYRGSLRLMGRAAVVLRKGPGLRLQLRGDRVLAVTVDDADTAAGLLNDLVARRV